MKKIIKSGLTVLMAALMLLPAYGCDNGGGLTSDSSSSSSSGSGGQSSSVLYDTEKEAFTMAVGALDGNFNPFFYTAANDGNVVSMTQASMLSTDSKGNITCGEDVPTVVKDYTITSYSSTGTVVDQGAATKDNTEYTTYSFLIKNGMKFSDGEDLTIMDVLFSLYVNIDWAYTGSATLYSNDIQGLKAYREQDSTLTDDATTSSTSYFTSLGQQRIDNILDYCDGAIQADNQILADIETVKELFHEEVESDWTSAESTFGSRDEKEFEYNFEETWEYFYLQEGIISVQTTTNSNGATVKDTNEDGTYKTTLDTANGDIYKEEIAAVKEDETAIKAYTDAGYDRDVAIEYVVRDYCIDYLWSAKTGGYTADGNTTNKNGIAEILEYWATATTALEKFTADERTAYFDEKMKDGKLEVETISGVTTERVTSFNGEDFDGTYYDVLNITINGVDPKAIYNFAFSVCPLHYYSGEWEGTDYVEEAMADYEAYKENWEKGDKTSQITHFGVKYGDSYFFNEVLSDTDKTGLPVGAGPYKATDINNSENPTRSAFWNNKMVYYVRNEYFETMGTGINNAIIKYVRYKEMSDNNILTSLLTGSIDYGTPSTTTANMAQLLADDDLDATTLYYTNGYGYVGVNPKYVPDVQVRQAIMTAMQTTLTVEYYTSTYCDVIYRPMSKTSWAYPDNCGEYESIAFDATGDSIDELMTAAKYYKNKDGIYTNGTTTCKFTFTIAGETSDHPAYNMFKMAETILEQHGFDITVVTDSNALNKLATGSLTVWAAAWSSAIDPDMYQVYHKDSTASSVKNWNYSEILANPTAWTYEYNIIQELSDVIDEARETNNQDNRKASYATALDLVMDLAVELPTYQRMDVEVYNKKKIASSSLNQDYSCYSSLIDRIWEIDFN